MLYKHCYSLVLTCFFYDQSCVLSSLQPHDLHWLRVPQRIEFKLAVLVYRCLHGMAPPYLARELRRVTDIDSRRRLRSADICARSAIDASCYHRRPCLWRRRCPCMEHSAGRRHVIVITACLQATSQNFLIHKLSLVTLQLTCLLYTSPSPRD